jgi:hypothetical protein
VPARILTVFREGGDYRPEHVERIRKQCARHAPDTEFLCLEGPLLTNDWPGWWSKIHLFLHPGPVLYMDLDTLIVNSLQPLLDAAEQHEFIALLNPMDTPSKFGSGLMAWNGDLRYIYDRFAADPGYHMARCKTSQLWGDQGFISEDCPDPAFWQDLFPDEILSWKVDCKTGIPHKARVVYFHGQPRPFDIGL